MARLMLVASLVLLLTATTIAKRGRPKKLAQVMRQLFRKGNGEVLSIEIDGKEKLLNMTRNEKLDRTTRTYAVKKGEVTELHQKERGCFHQAEDGSAALNLCNKDGVEGVVNDDSGTMQRITRKPVFRTKHTAEEERAKGMVERRRRSTDSNLHVLERVRREDDTTADYRLHVDLDRVDREKREAGTAGPEAEVELAFVVDYAMYSRHGSNVNVARDYVLSIANTIDIFYKTVTYPRITISVSSIFVITDRATQSWINEVVYSDGHTVESGDLLESFSTWLASGPLDDSYDHAMLLSGLDFCSPNDYGTCSTSNSGLAWMSSACSNSGSKVYASSVSEEHGGYSRLFTIAHELGHNLGASHDGSSNPIGGPGGTACVKSDGYIMGQPKHHYAFSPCSTAQFQYYFGLSKASCLYEQSSTSHYFISEELPGASLSLDDQCQAEYGIESAKCSWKQTDICVQLWCDSDPGYCGSKGPALIGSPCPGGFCYAGACVSSLPNEDVMDVNGGWSDWSSWGTCSVTCGGGTKTRSRTCSNPYPQGNGTQCSGTSSETISCGAGECPTDPCQLPDVSVATDCIDYNIRITYNGNPYDCKCFYKETGKAFCDGNIAQYCCESKTKVCSL